MTRPLAETIRQKLLAREAGGPRGDWAGGEALAIASMPTRLVSASVLIPIVDHGDQPATLLLTKRAAHLKRHAGQVSFPGGVTQPNETPLEGALREAQEEIGLDPARVEILGRLDDYVTTSDFRVVPIIGWLTPPLDLVPDPSEVETIFEVPLGFLLDPKNRTRGSRTAPDGTERGYYVFPHKDHFIWGATAAMLVNLGDVLGPLA